MNQDDLGEQMKTLMSFKVPESKFRFLKDVWYMFIIFFCMGVGCSIWAAGSYWACVSRWPDKTFGECMRYDIEPKRIRK